MHRRFSAFPSELAGPIALGLFVIACTDLTAPPNENPDNLPQIHGSASGARDLEKVAASHILIAYAGARNTKPEITRSREQARALAEKIAIELAAPGADFGAMAKKYSNDPGTRDKGGDLGAFSRQAMVKAFSDAAFGLGIGEISNAVETEFGFHIIKRTR